MWLVDTRGSERLGAHSPVDSSGISNFNFFAAYDFARGITAADKAGEARAALEQLRARIEQARTRITGVTRSWLDNITAQEIEQATLMANVLAGTIQYHEGDKSAGITQIRAAIASADRMVFEYGPPWSVKPFDEVLGELLLADGRRQEAAAAFQKTLAVYPNRRLAREGLAASQAVN
jgi:predicted Zn-dependent protease